MENTTRTVVVRDLHDSIVQHLAYLRELDIITGAVTPAVPEGIIRNIETLAAFCVAPPAAPGLGNTYYEVCACVDELKAFLALIHYNENNTRAARCLHRLLAQAQDWCQAAARAAISLDSVWQFLDPVQPDSLIRVDAEVFEAVWWQPVPWMDIEILRRTEGVIIHNEIASPDKLPGGIAVRFALRPACASRLDKGA